MKFGKQLQLQLYPPWRENYVAYSRFKRLIKRIAFLRDEKLKSEQIKIQKTFQAASRSASTSSLVALGVNNKGVAKEKKRREILSLQSAPGMLTVKKLKDKYVKGASETEMTPLAAQKSRDRNESSVSVDMGLGAKEDEGSMDEAAVAAAAAALVSWREARSAVLGALGPDAGGADPRERHLSEFEDETDVQKLREDWDRMIGEELVKVNGFHAAKLQDLEDRFGYFLEHNNQAGTQVYAHHSDFAVLRELYTEAAALSKYADLNLTGFRKILKKHDKALNTNLQKQHMPWIQDQPFANNLQPVEDLKLRIEDLVGRDHLLQFVRKAVKRSQGERTKVFNKVKWRGLAVSIALFVFFLHVEVMNFPTQNEADCFAMLMFLTSMWVTEAVPYFVTALMIPALCTLMGFLELSSKYDAPSPVAKKLMTLMVNNTTILILGGFSISAAFSKCGIELHIANFMQQALGHRPKLFALAIMLTFLGTEVTLSTPIQTVFDWWVMFQWFVALPYFQHSRLFFFKTLSFRNIEGLFLSAWISNHTAPVLCISFLSPILKDLPPGSPYAKFLLLGLAFACNFGGMMTPIASMQNALSVNALQNVGYAVSFGGWIACAVPYCVAGVVGTWCLLAALLRPDDVALIPPIVDKPAKLWTRRTVFVVATSLGTVIAWSTISLTVGVFGDLGIISLLFMGLMFGSGVLTQHDFNSFSWHLLFLLGGGDVLGQAIQQTDLLAFMSEGILSALPRDNIWLMTLLVSVTAMGIATFVSHTVAAVVLMPLIVQLGSDLHLGPHLGVGTAFAVSTAMALPFSSFPNMNSLMVVDDLHRPYVNLGDFVRLGLPASLYAIALLCTVGYVLIVQIFPDKVYVDPTDSSG